MSRGPQRAPLVVKFGGELLEEPDRLRTVVEALARVARLGEAVVVVHGGGKEIDKALQAAGIAKRQVDGLRITDEATRDVVVAVLAGSVNTRLVAALTTAGVAAVGLTGADGWCGRARLAPRHLSVDGQSVDLGLVGVPDAGDTTLVETLVDGGYVPVIACVGLDAEGRLLNVNADTFASELAARLRARRLVIVGTTAGVLDETGATVPRLDDTGVSRIIADRTATAGMVAKLRACTEALARGVADVVIVDGRDAETLLEATTAAVPARATQIVARA